MTKFIKEFVKQNKYIDGKCDKCGAVIKELSAKVFAKDTYTFTCPKCGDKSLFSAKEFEKKIISSLPNLLQK